VKETGKTVLYTTHYIEEAAQICTKIGILKQGRIIAYDSPEALKARIKKDEQIDLVVEDITPTQVESLRSLQGVISLTEKSDESTTDSQRGLHIELQSVDLLPSVFDFLFEHKIKLVNFKREEPTLEDAFVELTRSA